MKIRHLGNSYFEALLLVLFVVSLYFISLESFLLFHSIVEIASIIIVCTVFLIVWNSRNYMENSYLLFLGISYLFVAGIDFFHTLSYKGMGVFPNYDADLATQLWISARYMESVSLLIAPFMLGRKLRVHRILSVYFAVTFLLFVVIFRGYFPDCFIEGSGLTPFKILSEYVISLILLASLFMLHKHKAEFSHNVYNFLSVAIVFTIFAELAFTFYIDVYGFSNLVGHYFKLLSFYLIYKAIVVTGLMRPYELLYRELKMKEYNLVKEKESQESLLETLGLVNKILRHDILNDLNIISLSIDNLKERMNEKELDMSHRAVDHSLKIIRDMKDLESLISIKGLSTIDLRLLLMETAQEFPVTVNITGDCSVKADNGLRSVIGNIIQNAIVHGKADRIDVSMKEINGSCELRISDNGSGIADKIKGRVFEEGFKYGRAGHTGLGLYIARKIVERYGKISLEDNVPSGATFILRLNIADAAARGMEQEPGFVWEE